jgi:subtilisin family serine protease
MNKNLYKIILLIYILFISGCSFGRHNSTPELIDDPDPIENPDPTEKPEPQTNSGIDSIANEPYYKYAWHFNPNADFSQQVDIDPQANIHIEDAWSITKGENVKVAIIDAGDFDVNHVDLRENIIAKYNADNKNQIMIDTTEDEASHGSTAAGFIASPINGKGLVGAAPKAQLILIQQVENSDSKTIEAFRYAKELGAKVISNSWGTYNVSQTVENYLQELKDDGITIIFASGNGDENSIAYNMDNRDSQGNEINDESELESVIGIGATNEENEVTSYSNYGRNIDLLAPGGSSIGVLGIDNSGYAGSSAQYGFVNNNYAFVQGTSFSAPIAAGVVALMLSVNPSLTPDQIRDILIQTADKIGENPNYINGFDLRRGYGKINAYKAVNMARDY